MFTLTSAIKASAKVSMQLLALFVLILALAGCGGGGNSSPTTLTPSPVPGSSELKASEVTHLSVVIDPLPPHSIVLTGADDSGKSGIFLLTDVGQMAQGKALAIDFKALTAANPILLESVVLSGSALGNSGRYSVLTVTMPGMAPETLTVSTLKQPGIDGTFLQLTDGLQLIRGQGLFKTSDASYVAAYINLFGGYEELKLSNGNTDRRFDGTVTTLLATAE